jgi:hypothetical protein
VLINGLKFGNPSWILSNPDALTIPSDTQLMLEIHNYDPYFYAQQIPPSVAKWGSAADIAALNSWMVRCWKPYKAQPEVYFIIFFIMIPDFTLSCPAHIYIYIVDYILRRTLLAIGAKTRGSLFFMVSGGVPTTRPRQLAVTCGTGNMQLRSRPTALLRQCGMMMVYSRFVASFIWLFDTFHLSVSHHSLSRFSFFVFVYVFYLLGVFTRYLTDRAIRGTTMSFKR